MADYLNIKNTIKTILSGITGIKIVHSYEKADLQGFPAVVILGFSVNDTLEDTAHNTREYTFKVRVFQELATTDEGKGEEIMDNLVDKIMDAFATDFTLSGNADGCWVTSGLGWVDREIEMRVWDLEVLAKKLICIA